MKPTSKADILWIAGIPNGRLGVMPRPRGDDWLEDELTSWRASGVNTIVSLLPEYELHALGLAAEPEICARIGVELLSLPITDMDTPNSHEAVLGLARTVQQKLHNREGVVIHCRGGIGRSGTIAGCVMALFGIEPDRAFRLITEARGIDAPETFAQRQWVREFYSSLHKQR